MSHTTFPELVFKPLEPRDEALITRLNMQPEPYSDFNFVSLWSNDIHSDTVFTVQDMTLMLRMRDYLTDEPMYTFQGTKNVSVTAKTLLKRAREEGLTPILKLIPETVILSDPSIHDLYIVQEDRDNFDYILSVTDLVELPGNAYLKKRNMVNRFFKDYPEAHITLVDQRDEKVRESILSVMQTWEALKGLPVGESDHEFTAIRRLINSGTTHNILIVGIYVADVMVAFSIVEPMKASSIIHFQKADFRLKGIYEALQNEIAKVLQLENCTVINFEQDLGTPGLRASKEQWNPVRFLKKYTIQERV